MFKLALSLESLTNILESCWNNSENCFSWFSQSSQADSYCCNKIAMVSSIYFCCRSCWCWMWFIEFTIWAYDLVPSAISRQLIPTVMDPTQPSFFHKIHRRIRRIVERGEERMKIEIILFKTFWWFPPSFVLSYLFLSNYKRLRLTTICSTNQTIHQREVLLTVHCGLCVQAKCKFVILIYQLCLYYSFKKTARINGLYKEFLFIKMT